MSTLLVLGGTGFVGSRVAATAREHGWRVVVGSRSAGPGPGRVVVDVTAPGAVAAALEATGADAVLNAAACLRGSAEEALAVHVDGAARVARATRAAGVRLVHVSTDCVHGGRPEPYPDDAPPTPLAWAYARTKAAGEAAVLAADPHAALVRPSVVLGPGGPHQHADGTYFTDMLRSPVHVDDLAALLVHLAGDRTRGTLHAGGPREVDRHTLARALARADGLDPDAVRPARLAGSGLARPAVLRLAEDGWRATGVQLRGVEEFLPLD